MLYSNNRWNISLPCVPRTFTKRIPRRIIIRHYTELNIRQSGYMLNGNVDLHKVLISSCAILHSGYIQITLQSHYFFYCKKRNAKKCAKAKQVNCNNVVPTDIAC